MHFEENTTGVKRLSKNGYVPLQVVFICKINTRQEKRKVQRKLAVVLAACTPTQHRWNSMGNPNASGFVRRVRGIER